MKRAFILFLPLMLVGCDDIHMSFSQAGRPQKMGNGTPKEISRKVAEFNKVVVGSAFEVEASEGALSPLTISADSNLVDDIKTEVKGGVLYVKLEGSISTKSPMKLKLRTPKITGFDASGATHIMVKLMSEHKFDLEGSGAAGIKLEGPVSDFACELSGASSATLSASRLSKVTLKLSGASSVTCKATVNSLTAELSGASWIKGLNGNSANISLSGASNADLGRFGSVTKEVSGASNLKIDGRNDNP